MCVVEEPSDSLSAPAKGGGTNERTGKKRVGAVITPRERETTTVFPNKSVGVYPANLI
jgi:hypothetical protein